jgi:hypothetical protein
MKKNILITSGIVVLVLLLAGAALIGGRLLNGQPLPGGSNLFPGAGNGPGEVRMNADDILPSKELPQTPADVRGLFDHRENNSFFVGTGQITLMVQRDQSGNVESSSNASGPTIEIVVTNDTVVYHDTTLEQYNGQPPAGQKIQQVVEPGSLDDVGENSTITVWGKKTGDRVIADILVYTTPSFAER